MRKSNKKQIESAICEYILKNGISTFNFTKLSEEIGISKRMILHYYETKESMLQEIAQCIFDEYQVVLNMYIIKCDFNQAIDIIKTALSNKEINSQIAFWLDLTNLTNDAYYSSLVKKAIFELENMFDRILADDQTNRNAKINLLVLLTEGCVVLTKVENMTKVEKRLNQARKIFVK
jgi:hypothetical protein